MPNVEILNVLKVFPEIIMSLDNDIKLMQYI